MRSLAYMIDSMKYGGISFSGVLPKIYGLSSQKHLTAKSDKLHSQISAYTQGLDSTGQIQKNVLTLTIPTTQTQTQVRSTTGSIYKLPDDKNTRFKYDLLEFENQKIQQLSNKSSWEYITPINRTRDPIISIKQQDTIKRIFKDYLKKPNVVSSKLDLRIHQDEISKQFDVVKKWRKSWSEHGLEKPNDLTITHAENVIEKLLDLIISNRYRWINPFISGDGDGNVSSIWYQGKRELHLKIYEDDVDYFKVWGININTEMEVDSLEFDKFLPLWKWLINE